MDVGEPLGHVRGGNGVVRDDGHTALLQPLNHGGGTSATYVVILEEMHIFPDLRIKVYTLDGYKEVAMGRIASTSSLRGPFTTFLMVVAWAPHP